MKILHIIPSLNKGGAERLVLDICNVLKNRTGIQIKLITFHSNNAYSFLTDSIDWEIIPSEVIPSISGKTIIKTTQLQAAIDAFQPQVIHSHLFESEMVLSQINFQSAKYFVHFHDNMVQFENLSWRTILSKRSITNYFEKRIVLKTYKKRSTHFIGISQNTLGFIQGSLPSQFEKTFLHNAIDLKLFFPNKTPKKLFHVTMIGSLVNKKGQDLAIDTIAELNGRGMNVFLNILGEGVERKRLESIISQYNLNDNIQLHGNVEHPEKFLNDSILYIHTAKYEPFGLVILEAMACGLPVICTDGKGNRDLIQEGENGFMVWERNPVLLADKIELLINNEEKRIEMGSNARKFAEGFGIEKYVDQLLEIYNLDFPNNTSEEKSV